MATSKGKGLALIIGIGGPRRDAGAIAEPSLPPEARRRHAADVEAHFLGRPQPYGSYEPEHDIDAKVPAPAAGYMELTGAQKDGGCGLVEVEGGVSGEHGCCNLFDPVAGAQAFQCANCEHFERSPRVLGDRA